MTFLLGTESWLFGCPRFEPGLLSVTLIFATPKAVCPLGAALLKRLFNSSESLECIMALLNSLNCILTKEGSGGLELLLSHVS